MGVGWYLFLAIIKKNLMQLVEMFLQKVFATKKNAMWECQK